MKNFFRFVFAAVTVAMLSTSCGGGSHEATEAAADTTAHVEEAMPAEAPAADTAAAAAPADSAAAGTEAHAEGAAH